MKNCNLYDNGKCTCYLEKCELITDCAPKMIIKRNMESVNKLITDEK